MNQTIEISEFRNNTRAWLEASCPTEMRKAMSSDDDTCWGGRKWKFASDAQKLWLERLAERGSTVPTWPKEYGGGGLTGAEAKVLAQEMASLGCRPPVVSFGIWMLGPALLKFGTHEQKLEHLPKIARGEIRWCQGFGGGTENVDWQLVGKHNPSGSVGTAQDIAGLAILLCSRAGEYVVGQTIACDGGVVGTT